MIKSGGINVAPAEVEDFLATHPQVKEAYALGLSDPVKGEVVIALVQRVAGAQSNGGGAERLGSHPDRQL